MPPSGKVFITVRQQLTVVAPSVVKENFPDGFSKSPGKKAFPFSLRPITAGKIKAFPDVFECSRLKRRHCPTAPTRIVKKVKENKENNEGFPDRFSGRPRHVQENACYSDFLYKP